GRLIAAAGPPGTGSWSYDGDGNLTQTIQNGITTTYGYSATAAYSPTNWLPGELIALTTTGQPTTHYGYDNSGHTTAITTTAGYSQGLTYDLQGRIVGATIVSSTYLLTATGTYNASGLRSSLAITRTGSSPYTHSFSFVYGDDTLVRQALVVRGTTTFTD